LLVNNNVHRRKNIYI